MDVPQYDVYLTGQLATDISRELAAERLAQIFKTAPATMLGLLTGKAQLLKRGVDKNTALKYRDALQRAGVEVAFKAQTTSVANAETSTSAPPIATPTTALSLAPAGADVLSADERTHTAVPMIDVSYLSLAAAGPLIESTQPNAAPINRPTIDHLSLAAAGSDLLLPTERTQVLAAAPDISNLSLAPAGAVLETLHAALPAVEVDISDLSLAPSGADLLPPEQRRITTASAPNTDHIKLA